jgi:hypothetical protein
MSEDAKVGKGIPVEEIQTSPQERESITRLLVQRIDVRNHIEDLKVTQTALDVQIAGRYKLLGLNALVHNGVTVSLVQSKGRETLNKELLQVNLLGVGLDAGTVSDVLTKSVKVGEAFEYVKVVTPKGGSNCL